jgi:hypothetical protein
LSWIQIRRSIGPQLARDAALLYESLASVPAEPLPLDKLAMRWEPDVSAPVITGGEPAALATLPSPAYARYTSAIRDLAPPTLFEDRRSYRLLSISWSSNELTFGASSYFDKLDVSEALAHEAAAAALNGEFAWPLLPFRALVGNPLDLTRRSVNPGIVTLTIRRAAQARSTGSFSLLRRDPTRVAGGHYSLVPAGEFQPIGSLDGDLWRNIVREYSEELLGRPVSRPFSASMTAGRESGKLRAYILGIVFDALTLNAVIATAVVIDSDLYDVLFRDLVLRNAEGDIVHGHRFDAATIARLTEGDSLGQTSASCLRLAWRHRHLLLHQT